MKVFFAFKKFLFVFFFLLFGSNSSLLSPKQERILLKKQLFLNRETNLNRF